MLATSTTASRARRFTSASPASTASRNAGAGVMSSIPPRQASFAPTSTVT